VSIWPSQVLCVCPLHLLSVSTQRFKDEVKDMLLLDGLKWRRLGGGVTSSSRDLAKRTLDIRYVSTTSREVARWI
jgi:hypothetical protein